MNNKVKTKTKIGNFIVDLSSSQVVNILIDNYLILNQIVYWGVIENFMGKKGITRQGWTVIKTINYPFFDIRNEFDLLINPKITQLFPASGGQCIN